MHPKKVIVKGKKKIINSDDLIQSEQINDITKNIQFNEKVNEIKTESKPIEKLVNKSKKWDNESYIKCSQLLSQGKSINDIANEMGRSEKAIVFRRYKYIYDQLQNGKTITELSKQLHILEHEVIESNNIEIENQKQLTQKKTHLIDEIKQELPNEQSYELIKLEQNQSNKKTHKKTKKNKQKDESYEVEEMIKMRDLMIKNKLDEDAVKLTNIINKRLKDYVDKKL